MIEYKPENYKIQEQALERIMNLNREINSNFISLGFDYTNKILGHINNERFHEIRDSILLRMNSILFHFEIISSINNPNHKKIVRSLPPMLSLHVPMRQKYIFDSIIFNTISTFDYLSCLITAIREKNKDNWKKMWSSLEHFTRKNEAFKNTSLGGKILFVNKEWVNNLNNYRAELIHYKTEHLGSTESYDLMNGTLDIKVFAPYPMKNHFKQLKEIADKNDFNLNSICLWIIETSFQLIKELQIEIKVFIEDNRLISDENAIYTFRK